MSKKFKAYFINKNYYLKLINGLKTYNHSLKDEVPQIMTKKRPYIGFVGIKINGMDYAIPLTSDETNKIKVSKGYSLLIEKDGKKLGVLRINKMIPIIKNDHFINQIDINQLDYDSGIRLFQELDFLNQPEVYDKVHELANEIYNRRVHATDEQLDNDLDLKYAVDFNKAEGLMIEYAYDLYLNNLLDLTIVDEYLERYENMLMIDPIPRYDITKENKAIEKLASSLHFINDDTYIIYFNDEPEYEVIDFLYRNDCFSCGFHHNRTWELSSEAYEKIKTNEHKQKNNLSNRKD